MALDVNGYNAAFGKFVQFAQENRNVDKGRAILDAKIQGPLGGRKILSINLAQNDSVHNWTCGLDQWTVNDRTRAIFKAAVPSEKAQKALSCFMHQGTAADFMALSQKAPPDAGKVALHELPGGNMFAARDMATGNFMLPVLDDKSMDTTFQLDVAPDGNTATLTLAVSPGLTEGFSKGDTFGQVKLTRQMTFDLQPEVPIVTDLKVAQEPVA